MNSNATTITGLDDQLQTLGRHLRRYRREYTIAGVSILAGAYLHKKTQKPVDIAKIIDGWVEGVNARGLQVYTLGPAQHELWQSIYGYVKAVSAKTGKSMDTIAAELTRDYQIDAGYYLRK